MPRVVWILGAAILVQGTSELMLAGLLPEIATDLGVSLPTAGLLISGFAVGMLVGAPLLAVATRRLAPRATLLTFLGVFAAAHVLGALAPGYGVLLASRVVGAVVYAGFWAVAAATAVAAAPEAARGRAMSVVVGGLTVSVLVGLPAGTALGQALGWRAAFWAVAAATVLLALAVAATMPATAGTAPARPLRRDLAEVLTVPVGIAWATIALATAGLLATYSYLAPIITNGIGLAPGWVPVILALYGAGSVAGIVVGGRTADRSTLSTLRWGLVILIAGSVALAWTVPVPAVVIPLVVLLGFAGFFLNPAMQLRVFRTVGPARDLAAAGSVSAFNVGIALGPWLGGLVLAPERPTTVAWVGAALGVLALAVVVAAPRVEAGSLRRRRHTPAGQAPAGQAPTGNAPTGSTTATGNAPTGNAPTGNAPTGNAPTGDATTATSEPITGAAARR